MKVVLDTSVLLGPAPNFGDAEVAISVISLAELHFAVLVADTQTLRAERLRRLGLIENTFDALPVDDAVARECGQLAAAVVGGGRKPGARLTDLLIAATARAHGAELWTHNTGDFTGLGSLVKIRTPSRI